MPSLSANGVTRGAHRFTRELTTALTICEGIGSVRSLTVYLMLKYGEFDQYASLECLPSNYSDPNLFGDDYLVTKVLSKHVDLPTTFDRKETALASFRAAEERCKETNERLSAIKEGTMPPDVARVVHHAREYIRSILGRLTKRKLTEVYDACRFGPGATTSLSGVVTLGKKFSKRTYNCTSRLLDFAVFCRPPGWRTLSSLELRESSKVRVVPKNAKTDRTICVEPDLNIYVQLGIGTAIRERLRDFGLDLNTQEKNQRMARLGSLNDSLCTMDLSSASDLISREVVWLLLPHDWCDLLHFARTDSYELDGKVAPFHKWSSMGNGYTFELESLIFYGILLGASEVMGWEGDVTAYGDDLIFPSSYYSLVSRALEFLGFRVNAEKTFGKGLFRESCGTDWFLGRNVRPFFWKGHQNDQVARSYSCANALRRWAHRRNNGGSCDSRLLPAWLRLFTSVPHRDRHKIPEGYGDVGFISNWDEAAPRRSRSSYGWSGWSFSYRVVPTQHMRVDIEGAFIRSLHTPTDFDEGVEPLRGKFLPALTKRGYSLEWPDMGPWL